MNFKIKNKFLKISISLLSIGTITPILILSSCSKGYIIDEKLKSHFVDWYNNLTKANWNKDKNNKFINYHSESEQQSISLYANFRGWFWNEYLHKNQEPPNQMVDIFLDNGIKHEIRGNDYQKIVTALNKATFPYDYLVYHGVEYQEDEFYDQLKNFIKYENNKWDFSGVIGQTITSYGFISTSLNKEEAFEYCDGWNWIDNTIHLPLKEKAVFFINIPKGTKGAAYLADFSFAGTQNQDNQVLINKNSSFKIIDVKKEKDINIFYMDMISNN